MQQKIIKVGNSLGVTLPRFFVKALKLKAGQKVVVDANPTLDLFQLKTKTGKISSITPEFVSWMNSFNKKYSKSLKELAKK